MARGKGKRVAAVLVIAGMAVLAVTGFAQRDKILESWYLRKLRKGDESERIEAIGRLAFMAVDSAARPIAELVKPDENPDVVSAALDALCSMRGEAHGELISILMRTDDEFQERVAAAIIEMPPPIDDIASRIVPRLGAEQSNVLLWVLSQLLTKLVASDRAAAESLLGQMLRARDPAARLKALASLWHLGLDAKIYLPLAAEMASDPLPDIRAEAIRLVGASGLREGLPTLLLGLRDPVADVRSWAAQAVGSLASSVDSEDPTASSPGGAQELLLSLEDAVPHLARGLADRSALVAESCAQALLQMNENILRDLFKEGSVETRIVLARPLAFARSVWIGHVFAAGLEDIAAKKDPSEEEIDLAHRIFEGLSIIEERARPAVPVLIELASKPPLQLQYPALTTLADLGSMAVDSVPVLITLLAAEDVGIRQRAALVLKGLHRHAAPAIDQLAKLLEDPDVAGYAADALGAIGPLSLPHLERMLSHRDAAMRIAAVEAIAQMGDEASEMIPALIEALKDTQDEVRYGALLALNQMGNNDELPELLLLLADDSPSIRFAAASMFVRLGGPNVARALPPLADIARDQGLVLPDRLEAIDILAGAGGAAVEELVKILADEEVEIQVQAAVALGSIGPDARSALGALRGQLPAKDESLRSAVEAAIQSLRAPAMAEKTEDE